MKKIILFLLMVLASANCFSQKKYLLLKFDVLNNSNVAYIFGERPSSIKQHYSQKEDFQNLDYSSSFLPVVLDLLAKEGYSTIEYVYTNSNYSPKEYLISNSNASSNSQQTRIESYYTEDEIYEVSRFNLQGIPVTEKDKGIQIVVYSNYTTKTIIVE